MVIPIFSSHYSFARSLLTLDEPKKDKEFDESRPISIFSIVKKHNLKDIYLVDNTFSGFLEAWKNSQKLGVNLRFGYKITCCSDLEDRSENSFNSEHKIIIWLKSSESYKYAIKIATKAQTDGFYYIPRIDKKWLNDLWDDSLQIGIPFYDSFVFNNTLSFSKCLPEFPSNPIAFIEDNDLPFDGLIQEKVKSISTYNKWETQTVKSIYYYKNCHFKAYQVFRCINSRTNLEKPELKYMSSDKFSFEEYLKSCNKI